MSNLNSSENSSNQFSEIKVRYITIDLDLQELIGNPACVLLDTIRQMRSHYHLLKHLEEQSRLKRPILNQAIQTLIKFRIIERFHMAGYWYEYRIRPEEMWSTRVQRKLKIGKYTNDCR